MNSLSQNLSLKQRLKINPKQIQFLNFLYYNYEELDAHIEKELLENPFLEKKVQQECLTRHDQGNEAQERLVDVDNAMQENEVFNTSEIDTLIPSYKTQDPNSSIPHEWKERQENNLSRDKDFRTYYADQVRFIALTEDDLELAVFIIYSTEDDGLLHMNLQELTDEVGFSKGSFYQEESVKEMKKVINGLEPVGFACYDLRDYLLCQVKYTKDEPLIIKKMAKLILNKYFDSFVNKDYETIVKETGVRKDDLSRVVALIKSFPTTPMAGLPGEASMGISIQPDYKVYMSQGKLKGDLADDSYTSFEVNDKYAKVLAKSGGKKSNKFVKDKLASAHWFKNAMQQRFETMTEVIQTIVYLQGDYLQSGELKDLKPMILKDVAHLVGMEVSTVSRVTSDKYAHTPIGLVNLKDLFTEGIELMNGTSVSNREVKAWVREVIGKECKDKPLSDNEIRKLLEQDKGLIIGRRTVAKYRIEAQLPSAKRRKR